MCAIPDRVIYQAVISFVSSSLYSRATRLGELFGPTSFILDVESAKAPHALYNTVHNYEAAPVRDYFRPGTGMERSHVM